jgi:hypothetical protein
VVNAGSFAYLLLIRQENAVSTPKSDAKKFITVPQLRERWGSCSHMFIERLLKSDPCMPRPMKLGGRIRFFAVDEIERYERSKVHAAG